MCPVIISETGSETITREDCLLPDTDTSSVSVLTARNTCHRAVDHIHRLRL